MGTKGTPGQAKSRQDEVTRLMQEETEKVIHHIKTQLPKEVVERLDVPGGLKDNLLNFFNRSFQDLFNHYLGSTEDDIGKSLRDFQQSSPRSYAGGDLPRYAPRDITELLTGIGGTGKFNTGEIEKSLVNMYGHFQGHLQKSINELEDKTSSLLRHRTDTGAFIRGDGSYRVVKCSFRDNLEKPRTVTDLKLSINIPESDLISPIFHYQATAEYLIKDLLSRRIQNSIDKEIEQLRDERIDEGLEDLNDTDLLLHKLDQVEEFTDDNADQDKAKRYSLLAKSIMDRLKGMGAELEGDYDQLNIRENLRKIIDSENIRDRGFNTAINSITTILDNARLGFQYIENLKNARELVIREYEDTDTQGLPDERYQLRLRYYDTNQLTEARKAYDAQMKSFGTEVKLVWDILQVIYEEGKSPFKVCDFKDLTRKTQDRIRKLNKDQAGPYGDLEKPWDEMSFVRPTETEVEKANRTYTWEKENIQRRIPIIRSLIQEIYNYDYPVERRSLEDRLNFLEAEYNRFEYGINPYHLQPGLVLDMDITSIKRKKLTLEAMSNVLTEFLRTVSRGFQDAALSNSPRQGGTGNQRNDRFRKGNLGNPSPAGSASFLAGSISASLGMDETQPLPDSVPMEEDPESGSDTELPVKSPTDEEAGEIREI
ncbi:cytoplasmic filament protein A [Treponema primitia ZAS-2]|uniref:Cytoplasmic filament protein A n=1 Tax=Treponema primitia (strain ATCC BAA-887 / DSM 12427 / ZAS-2) TaxID=545694 RepID=F5YKD2_TREPZ|nr:cytoplasmic filament protein CfpA [Treponema primitia]AEF85249.1 cytoplasmic filament protein A [Treponema primitia ZAS-2]